MYYLLCSIFSSFIQKILTACLQGTVLWDENRTERPMLFFPLQTLKIALVLMPQQRYINIFHDTDILSFLSSHSETNNCENKTN